MTVTPPPSTAPNAWTLTSTYTTATDPTVALASSLSVTATPVPNSGGATVSATIPLVLYQPWIYAADDVTSEVAAFDEQGHSKTLAHPISAPGDELDGLLYDPHNGLLYVSNATANAVTAYRTDGSPYTLSAASPFAGLTSPSGLAFDPVSNAIYVVEWVLGGGGVKAFDEQGNALTLSGTFPGVVSAFAAAYDPNQDWFYVANCTPAAVKAFTSQGAAQTLTGNGGSPFPNLHNPDAIAFDPHNDWFYVDNCSPTNGTITAYDEQGNQQALPGNPSGILTGWGILYDPLQPAAVRGQRHRLAYNAYCLRRARCEADAAYRRVFRPFVADGKRGGAMTPRRAVSGGALIVGWPLACVCAFRRLFAATSAAAANLTRCACETRH